MKKLLALVAVLGLLLPFAPASAAPRERWDTRVFASVPMPGFPAYVFVHPNGRVYAATYTNPGGDSIRSRVFEWSKKGALLRSWTVPGQDLSVDHGVQVANADAHGRLVLLEKSTSRVMTLNVKNGKFRTWARLPDLPLCTPGTTGPKCSPNVDDLPAIPNYATWGPGGALFITDYGQAVIWRIPRRSVKPSIWLASPALDGSEFGTTGIVYRRHSRDLVIGQGSTTLDASVPANGKLYRVPIRKNSGPGALETMWTSRPGDVPDGFGIGRSGRIYIGNAGLSAQLVVISPTGVELERFPEVPLSGENGSDIPFDTPSNATFLGRRVLVANQSFTGNSSHHAILDVYVGEQRRTVHVPRRAWWRARR